MNPIANFFFRIAIALPFVVSALPAASVLIKPIPDKLIVLTFDDAPASHATVVAPILKEMGFGGTMYVCDFDSFRTRKDWYLTWRQMTKMAKDGFEIGNHTVGHGSSLEGFRKMDDALQAHGLLKCTTLCWPVYAVAHGILETMGEEGYTFGRGGHERPYLPTVDNPFDVPSYTIKNGVTVEMFIKQAQQACQGKVVVFCFHGVPDMEHPGVSLEPSTFRQMMQYLKNNHYQCIAMRDMAEYVDPAKAAKLPHTKRFAKQWNPKVTVQDDEPYVAPPDKAILKIEIPDAEVRRGLDGPVATVPYATDITALTPKISVSTGASLDPPSGTRRDFSSPQNYTVTSQDRTARTVTLTVRRRPISQASDVIEFALPGSTSSFNSGKNIVAYVPESTDVKALAPILKIAPLANCEPGSGITRNFTRPQPYTITAQDGTTRTYTVAVVKGDEPSSFTWSGPDAGNWSDASKWAGGATPATVPSSLNFDKIAQSSIANDLSDDFPIRRLILGEGGQGLILTGKSISFEKDSVRGISPMISVGKNRRRLTFDVPVKLPSDLHVQTVKGEGPNSLLTFKGVVSGTGAIVLDSHGEPDSARINGHDAHFGILQFENTNTYSGGTIVNGGKIKVMKKNGLGTGSVTLNDFGTLAANAPIENPVIINRGRLRDSTCSGPITLNSVTDFYGNCDLQGEINGPGGFTMLGKMGTYLSMIPGGTVTLHGPCSYRGPTTVFPGTLLIQKAAGLYGADSAQWTPENITVHKTATLRLNAGGEDEFTGAQLGILLKNLTTNNHENGLMGGAWFCVDTANATAPVELAENFTDSGGAGGGAITFKKSGTGTLQLTGANSYSGRTYIEGGALSVASFNRIENRKPSSSLGAPTTLEDGMIDLSGDCVLIYVGSGETTDRIIDLNGNKQTVTVAQSGNGLLKFTSPFDISGYGFDKTLVLTGSTSGTGEFASTISNPYDRASKAKTSITKMGTGTWFLSGANSFTGTTTLIEGTLALTNAQSLDSSAVVDISSGATLELDFKVTMTIHQLIVDGELQPAGIYGATTSPGFLKGTGVLKVASP